MWPVESGWRRRPALPQQAKRSEASSAERIHQGATRVASAPAERQAPAAARSRSQILPPHELHDSVPERSAGDPRSVEAYSADGVGRIELLQADERPPAGDLDSGAREHTSLVSQQHLAHGKNTDVLPELEPVVHGREGRGLYGLPDSGGRRRRDRPAVLPDARGDDKRQGGEHAPRIIWLRGPRSNAPDGLVTAPAGSGRTSPGRNPFADPHGFAAGPPPRSPPHLISINLEVPRAH